MHSVRKVEIFTYLFSLFFLNINNSDFQKLKKYKTCLRKLVKKSNLASKKKILVQNGGFLQFLIPAVITGISEIVSSLISKKSSDN